MKTEHNEPWIEIDDALETSASLSARVEEQLQQHHAELGAVSRQFPTFHGQTPDLDNLTGEGQAPLQFSQLRDTLRQLQELPPPATNIVLVPSPVTRLPLVGRFWRLVRSQAHRLVLFYVNRHLAHQAQTNHMLSTALHQLSALLLAQQQQIDRLHARLHELEQSREQSDGE